MDSYDHGTSGTTFYWNALQKNIGWIQHSESKLIFTLTLAGTIIGIVGVKHEGIGRLLENYPFAFWIGCFSLACIVASGVFSFVGLDPSLNNSNGQSLLYFGHIKQGCRDPNDYFKKSQQMLKSQEAHNIQVSDQVFVTSSIAWRKFKFSAYSLRCLVASIALALISSLSVIFS